MQIVEYKKHTLRACQNIVKLKGYEDENKFINNDANITIDNQKIIVKLKKKRNRLLVIENMNKFINVKYSWFNNKKLIFNGASYS